MTFAVALSLSLIVTLLTPATGHGATLRCPDKQREFARVVEVGPFAGSLTTSRIEYRKQFKGAAIDYGFGLNESDVMTTFFASASPPVHSMIVKNSASTNIVAYPGGVAFQGPESAYPQAGTTPITDKGIDTIVYCTKAKPGR